GDDPPAWIDIAGDIFPVKHLSEASLTAFNPSGGGWGFEWLDLAVIGAWGVAGGVGGARCFSRGARGVGGVGGRRGRDPPRRAPVGRTREGLATGSPPQRLRRAEFDSWTRYEYR